MKLSIKDYATLKSISLQAVYQSCKKGRIKCIEENGQRYVIVEPEEVKPIDEPVAQVEDQSVVKELLKQLKSKDKEIKRLSKELSKCNQTKENTFMQYITELKQLQLPNGTPEFHSEDAIDLEPVKKKKKRKKKK